MKFNLGSPDNDEKINWHNWFAWHPVIISSHNSRNGKRLIAFFEVVSRRRIYRSPETNKSSFYVYSDIV